MQTVSFKEFIATAALFTPLFAMMLWGTLQ